MSTVTVYHEGEEVTENSSVENSAEKEVIDNSSKQQDTNSTVNDDYGVIIKQPSYNATFERQKTHARPIDEGRRVLIVNCFDPRCDAATELVLNHIKYHGLYLQVRVAGGRSIDALRSIAVAHYLFQLEAIAVVHHTFCGCTSFTMSTIKNALAEEDGIHLNPTNLSSDCMNALTIDNLTKSVEVDVALIKERVASRFTQVWGFIYDIMTGVLKEVVPGN